MLSAVQSITNDKIRVKLSNPELSQKETDALKKKLYPDATSKARAVNNAFKSLKETTKMMMDLNARFAANNSQLGALQTSKTVVFPGENGEPGTEVTADFVLTRDDFARLRKYFFSKTFAEAKDALKFSARSRSGTAGAGLQAPGFVLGALSVLIDRFMSRDSGMELGWFNKDGNAEKTDETRQKVAKKSEEKANRITIYDVAYSAIKGYSRIIDSFPLLNGTDSGARDAAVVYPDAEPGYLPSEGEKVASRLTLASMMSIYLNFNGLIEKGNIVLTEDSPFREIFTTVEGIVGPATVPDGDRDKVTRKTNASGEETYKLVLQAVDKGEGNNPSPLDYAAERVAYQRALEVQQYGEATTPEFDEFKFKRGTLNVMIVNCLAVAKYLEGRGETDKIAFLRTNYIVETSKKESEFLGNISKSVNYKA